MSGFSLIEVLVALAIGMLATIVVLQLFTDSESRNRTSAGSADAQSNGLLTLYQMQSNIQRTGYGLNSVGLFNCYTSWIVASGSAIDKSVVLAPVSINPNGNKAGVVSTLIPAADANTDIVMVMMGNGNSEPQGNAVTLTTGAVYTVRTQSMFAVGDRVIATPSANPDACLGSTLNIDRVTASDSATSTVTTAYAGITASEPILYNLGPGPNSINASPIATMPTNGPTVLVYAVRNGSLTVCDFSLKDCSLAANAGLSSVWVPQADNVVSMRAAYWQDTSVAWDGSSSASNQTSPTTACNWAKVKALHLVLVTRSDQREKEVVTNSAVNVVNASAALSPAWNIAALNTAAPIVLGTDSSSTDQEWRHYRYKAFQALIPLRNITWMGSPPAGC